MPNGDNVLIEMYEEVKLLKAENEKLRAVADAVRKYADLYEIEKTNSGKDVIKTLEALDE